MCATFIGREGQDCKDRESRILATRNHRVHSIIHCFKSHKISDDENPQVHKEQDLEMICPLPGGQMTEPHPSSAAATSLSRSVCDTGALGWLPIACPQVLSSSGESSMLCKPYHQKE